MIVDFWHVVIKAGVLLKFLANRTVIVISDKKE